MPGMTRLTFLLLLTAVAATVAVLGFVTTDAGQGALLATLVIWTTIAQGSVAAVAVTDLTGARWSAHLRRELLASTKLLPFLAALFLLLWPVVDLYPWGKSPTAWLNLPFFLARNLMLLTATAGAAHVFARRSLQQDANRARYAVAYLILFVSSQSLVAFDWVMPLAYPWVSSMFGAYFFVEALYAGLALAGILFLLLDRQRMEEAPENWPAARRDLGTLLFGFSILWGGLFFAQFLLLWYGNIPEEVGFIVRLISSSPTRELSVFFIFASFAVPFLVFLSARAKRHAAILGAVSLSVLLGLVAEKLLFILPAGRMHFGVLFAENIMLLVVWFLAVRRACS